MDVNGKNSCRRKLRCIGCRLTRRTREKVEGGRSLVKARSAVLTHGRRFMLKGITAVDLVKRFGWRIQIMAQDIDKAVTDICPYCRRPFSEMPNGLADITLDVVDQNKDPYYGINTKWSCMTCNRAKAKSTPEQWARKLMCWEQFRLWESDHKTNPDRDTLFEGLFRPDDPGIQLTRALEAF